MGGGWFCGSVAYSSSEPGEWLDSKIIMQLENRRFQQRYCFAFRLSRTSFCSKNNQTFEIKIDSTSEMGSGCYSVTQHPVLNLLDFHKAFLWIVTIEFLYSNNLN